ncbi:hypothetical protein [Paenibacillus harenae]|uniref:ABC-type polysaccharide transport system permease subunit n=1 Tax=Paenibacillus harenae TaxID=306543 RepID=A0ABT9TZK9_PAEHA|nr:hypothetical protein [Paenibacillus harenae]MDQ0112822.1 ABC-type polysaccharide transport system permease subunit [Paenibacillus harenae]
MIDRIWKYKFHYIIVLPALLLIFIFKLIPFFRNIVFSFVDYKPFLGLFESPWVGFGNFKALFEDTLFRHALRNTLIINIGFALVAGVIAWLLALALSSIRIRAVRGAFQTIFLIPYVVPTVFIAGIVMLLLSPAHSPLHLTDKLLLADPLWTKPILIGIEVFRSLGIPAMIGLAAILSNKTAQSAGKRGRPNAAAAGRAIAAYLILQLSFLFSSDFELTTILVNPLIMDSGITIDHYIYTIGLMQANYGLSSAAGAFVAFIQFILVLLAYQLVRGRFLGDLFSGTKPHIDSQSSKHSSKWWGTAVSAIYAAIVLLFVYLLIIEPFTKKSDSAQLLHDLFSFWNIAGYTISNFAAAVVFMLVSVTLAYPLTVKKLPGRQLYKLFLLFVLIAASNQISEYFFFRELDMVNTLFPQIFTGFFSLASVFVLKSIFNSRHAVLKEQAEASGRGELHTFFTLFIPKVWKPLLALGVLQFIALWNAYLPSVIYVVREESYSPVAKGLRLLLSAPENFADPILWQYCAIISLPPIVLLLIFRKWIISEVLASQVTK